MKDNFMRGILLFCSLILCVTSFNGCNSGRKLVPVSGRVTIDGKPLNQGNVVVWVDDYRRALGIIQSDGSFSLMTHVAGDGCAIGDHRVTVESQKSNKEISIEYFVPTKYQDPDKSGLKLSVKEPIPNWDLKLTWKGDSHTGPFIVKQQ